MSSASPGAAVSFILPPGTGRYRKSFRNQVRRRAVQNAGSPYIENRGKQRLVRDSRVGLLGSIVNNLVGGQACANPATPFQAVRLF